MTAQTPGPDAAASAYSYPLLIRQLLAAPLATRPNAEIVYRDRVRHDYRTLRARIGQLASALAAGGVGLGDTVAVMDWDSHRYLESYFAVPMMGAVLMMVNVRLSPEQILYTLQDCRPRVLLVHRDFLPVIGTLRDRLDSVETLVLLDDEAPGRDLPEGCAHEYEQWLAGVRSDYAFPDFDENTRATTFYTTGTTGLPKGVFFSHRQLVLHTLAVMAALGSAATQGRLHREDVYMPITPMFHVHAWGLPYVATLMGLKQVYPGRYAPATLLGLIRDEHVTFSHCVPTILHMLLNEREALQVDLSGWKVVIGGSRLPKALAQAALDAGIDVFAGYGMSETGPILTLAQLDAQALDDSTRQAELRARTGLPAPLVELRIVDETLAELPHDGGSTGEVVVRAPWLTQGYRGNAQASETLWAGGWLHTGDIGSIDGDGWLQISDRVKDVIKTGGEWVSSLELEDILARHPGVDEAAVIGVPDPKWGERPLALIVRKAGTPIPVSAEDLKAHVLLWAERGAISRYAVPERVLFVESVDRTSVGKLDKKRLRQKYGQPAV